MLDHRLRGRHPYLEAISLIQLVRGSPRRRKLKSSSPASETHPPVAPSNPSPVTAVPPPQSSASVSPGNLRRSWSGRLVWTAAISARSSARNASAPRRRLSPTRSCTRHCATHWKAADEGEGHDAPRLPRPAVSAHNTYNRRENRIVIGIVVSISQAHGKHCIHSA